MSTHNLICQHCEQLFTLNTSPANARRQKYCGRVCAAAALKARVPPLLDSLRQRLAARTLPCDDGCILYTGQNNGRYGQIEYRRRTYLAHRAAFIVHKGDIPKGMMVCHSCDTPLCINPAHLWLGSGGENVRDMIAKNRQRYNPARKLSDEQIEEARNRLARGDLHKEIARHLNVSRSYITMLGLGTRRPIVKSARS